MCLSMPDLVQQTQRPLARRSRAGRANSVGYLDPTVQHSKELLEEVALAPGSPASMPPASNRNLKKVALSLPIPNFIRRILKIIPNAWKRKLLFSRVKSHVVLAPTPISLPAEKRITTNSK